MKIVILLAAVALLAGATGNPTPQFNLFPQIVGGEDAEIGEIPYQVELTRNGGHWCGGSIIDATHIVTAAHCLSYPIPAYQVIAGQHDRIRDDGTEQDRTIAQVKIHENYTYEHGTGDLSNDIAIITLSSPLEFNEHVATIQLPKQGHLATGVAKASGWGYLFAGGPFPDILQKVEMQLVTDDECERVWGGSVNPAVMICAGGDGETSVCGGDSGGPLVAYDHGIYLAGIASWAHSGCAVQGYYNGFTEVSAFIDWIAANIQN